MDNRIRFLVSIFLFAITFEYYSANSFSVRNVNFLPLHKTIHVYYDLIADSDQTFTVSLSLHRKSDTTFAFIPKLISGDCGQFVSPGKGNKIIWDIGSEIKGRLKGKDYFFRVEVKLD